KRKATEKAREVLLRFKPGNGQDDWWLSGPEPWMRRIPVRHVLQFSGYDRVVNNVDAVHGEVSGDADVFGHALRHRHHCAGVGIHPAEKPSHEMRPPPANRPRVRRDGDMDAGHHSSGNSRESLSDYRGN